MHYDEIFDEKKKCRTNMEAELGEQGQEWDRAKPETKGWRNEPICMPEWPRPLFPFFLIHYPLTLTPHLLSHALHAYGRREVYPPINPAPSISVCGTLIAKGALGGYMY